MNNFKPITNPDSGQKTLHKLVQHMFTTVDHRQFIEFYGWVLSGRSHVRHQQNLALAKAAGVTPTTAANWTAGRNECTCTGTLYALVRTYFFDEVGMAREFGEFIHRDLLQVAGLPASSEHSASGQRPQFTSL